MLKKGGSYVIKWSKTGNFANVNLWYSTDGGDNFDYQITASEPAANGTTGYTWSPVPNTPSPDVVIRVADANDPDTNSLSWPLAIQTTLNITQPDGGEVWAVGDPYDFTWTTDGTTTNVKLQYATNGGGAAGNWTDITGATNLVNTGTFGWTVPNAVTNLGRVRVVDLNDQPVDTYNPGNWNESAANFKIKIGLSLVSPNGNADPNLTGIYHVGDTVPIQWSLVGSTATVKLEYSVNGGAYQQITTPTTASAIDAVSGQTGCTPSPCWDWQIPNNISSQVKVRVVNEADTTVFDTSDNDFKIRARLAWTYPVTAADVFLVDDTKVLT